jgi:hypothetical protein
MTDTVWLAFELVGGNESLVGVYSTSDKAVAELKPLIKAHDKFLSEKEKRNASVWKSSVDGRAIECEFSYDGMIFSFYAVEEEVL